MELNGSVGSGYGAVGSGYGAVGSGRYSCFVKKSPNCYMKSMELTGAVSFGHGAVGSGRYSCSVKKKYHPFVSPVCITRPKHDRNAYL